ncbi:coil containing protein [Vibrio phage 1.082.O._10N.261.49.E4]|nr:coil containing protein [Vibrio phage 1.082.O._10N.261.49.E4]
MNMSDVAKGNSIACDGVVIVTVDDWNFTINHINQLEADKAEFIDYLKELAKALRYTHPEAHSIARDIECLLEKHKESEK